jgi:hypothetical protein
LERIAHVTAHCLLKTTVKAQVMLLEDASSGRGFSSVDFGRARAEAAANPKGIGLPPPTEFIHSPDLILDADSALKAARREKSSFIWRAKVQLRRVSDAAIDFARELAVKTWELLPKKNDELEELPEVEVSKEIDLDPEDQADTAPTPLPFPAIRRKPSASQWEVRTEIVDMTKRRKASDPRKVSTEDLTLDEPKDRKKR